MKKSILPRLRTLLVLSLALVLVLSLTGCFQKEEPTPTDAPEDPATQTVPVVPVSTEAPAVEPTEAPTEAPQPSVMGTVSANNLNVRSNPSSDSTVLSQLPVNLRIEILEQRTVQTATSTINWGRIGEMTLPNGTKVNGGWINLSYVKLDGEVAADPVTPGTNAENPPASGTGKKGTITATELNIRKSTSTSSDSLGHYIKGDVVEILEQKSVDGIVWGRTNKGWISMKYVKLDGQTATTTPENKEDEKPTTSSEVVSNGKTTALGYGVVDLGALNVRSGPGTNYDKVGTVTEGARYAYYQKDGNWVRIKNGWVSVSYFYIEGTSASDGGTGTVTATELNLRTGPDSSYKSNGILKQGNTVKVLAQVNGWGYTENGWVSMKYVDLTASGVTYTTGKGTIIADTLNIRKEASSTAEKVGSYDEGASVEILEVKDDWGKTDKGWINMKYVKMTSSTTSTEDNVGKNTTFQTGSATVEVNSTLTIRKEASTSAEKVGSYKNGDKITVTEVSGEWGKTDKGWVNLRYVKFG